MPPKKILAIIGSASPDSSNHGIVDFLRKQLSDHSDIEVFDRLHELPFFKPDQSLHNPPLSIIKIREKIATSDVVIICTPEYIFSLPASLKNLFEWCVAVTVFSNKPCVLIVASAEGSKAFEELKLLAGTLGGTFDESTCLLIQSVKAKVSAGSITDETTAMQLKKLASLIAAQ